MLYEIHRCCVRHITLKTMLLDWIVPGRNRAKRDLEKIVRYCGMVSQSYAHRVMDLGEDLIVYARFGSVFPDKSSVGSRRRRLCLEKLERVAVFL